MSADDFDIAPKRTTGPRKVKVTREAKTARIVIALAPIVLALVVVGPRLTLNSRWVKPALATKIASQVSVRTKSSVRRLGGVNFGWAYEPCLGASEIYRVRGKFEVSAKLRGACVERWPSALGSGFRAIQVKLDKPSFKIVGGQTPEPEPAAPVAAARSEVEEQKTETKRAPLREMDVLFSDLSLEWSDMPLPARLASGSFGPIDGSVTVQARGGDAAASLTLREPVTGMTIRGRALPTASGWDMTARVKGDLGPTFGPLFAAAGFEVKKLPVEGDVGVFYSRKDNRVTMNIDLAQFNVDIASKLVSAQRLSGITAKQKIRVNVDLNEQRVWIDDGLVEVNGIPAVFSVDVRLGGEATFTVGFELRTVPMIKLLRSIPGTQFPEELSEMSSAALFALSFSVSGALKDPKTWQPKLEHSLSGIGENASGSGLEYLLRPFTYYPLTKQGRSEEGRPAGPGSEGWVPYAQIPYVQRRAIQVSEDANFFVHHGVDIDEIQAAIVESVESGDRSRGGSTLTQQLVKNLFLSRDRTAMRKVQELILTFLVESALTKEQIFEIYANIIEWGPNLYGLREATNYYFNKEPRRLSHREMVYLASVIPGPLLFHKYYEDGFVPAKHAGKVDFMLKRLRKLDTIKTDPELEKALGEKIHFAKRTGITAIKQEAPPP